jgi:hypothetical protein
MVKGNRNSLAETIWVSGLPGVWMSLGFPKELMYLSEFRK